MRNRLLVGLLCIAVLGVTAAVASAALSGSYKTTISGKTAALNGKWQIKFASGHKANISRNSKVVVKTGVKFSGKNKVKFTDTSGSYACKGTQKSGTYTYKLSGKKLTYKVVSDKCAGRKSVLTSKAWTRG